MRVGTLSYSADAERFLVALLLGISTLMLNQKF
jgi:hypothetical protein